MALISYIEFVSSLVGQSAVCPGMAIAQRQGDETSLDLCKVAFVGVSQSEITFSYREISLAALPQDFSRPQNRISHHAMCTLSR
jgi:hypothetical protein